MTNVFKRKHPCKYNRGVEEKRKVGYKESQGAANPILVSRDIMDGNVPNYKQTEEGTLYKSIHGFPLCNYCNMPNHKRQHCQIKAIDRINGCARHFHPDRMKAFVHSTSSTPNSNQYPLVYPMQNLQRQPPLQPWQSHQQIPVAHQYNNNHNQMNQHT